MFMYVFIHLHTRNVSESSSEYYLQKLFDWQEQYDYVDWETFKNSWFLCSRCGGYDEGQCICYAR